jgi:pheromone a factor receptor
MLLTGHPFGAISVSMFIRCTILLLTPALASHFQIGATVAFPVASLCIARRLYLIASVRSASVSIADVRHKHLYLPSDGSDNFDQKRRAVLVDLGIGIGIPVLAMILRTSHLISIALG